MAGIEIRGVKKSYPVEDRILEVLRGVDLCAPEGEITVILGKSGCGKTTLLRLVGGLEAPDAGEIHLNGSGRTAFVFQEARLMPWLSVWGNVKFALRRGEADRAQIAASIRTVGLEGFERAHPDQLSGGMQQRTALARALVCRPSFILMDEPFAALDYFTRAQMQQELLRVQRERNVSILFVTHSIDEAVLLGQRIVILEDGRVKRVFENANRPRSSQSDEAVRLRRAIVEEMHIS